MCQSDNPFGLRNSFFFCAEECLILLCVRSFEVVLSKRQRSDTDEVRVLMGREWRIVRQDLWDGQVKILRVALIQVLRVVQNFLKGLRREKALD